MSCAICSNEGWNYITQKVKVITGTWQSCILTTRRQEAWNVLLLHVYTLAAHRPPSVSVKVISPAVWQERGWLIDRSVGNIYGYPFLLRNRRSDWIKSCQYESVLCEIANTSHVTCIGISYLQLHNPEVANTRFQYESCDLYLQLGTVPSCEYKISLGKHAHKRIKTLFHSGFMKYRTTSWKLYSTQPSASWNTVF